MYARKNYATVEINSKGREKGEWGRGTRLKVHVIFESYYKAESDCYILTSKNYEKVTDRDAKFICCCVGCVDNVSFVARRLETN